MQKESNHSKASSILNHTKSAYLIIDKKGFISYVSPTIKNLNLSKESLMGSSFIGLVDNQEKKIVENEIKNLIQAPSKTLILTFYSTIKKKKRLIESTLTNLLETEDIKGILVNLRDISNHPKIDKLEIEIEQRKEIEEQLKENKKRYQLLIEHANEGICVAQDGFLKLANPKLCEILKCKEKELLNKPFVSFIHPDDKNLVSKRHKARLQGKNVPPEYNFRVIDTDGHTHWVQIHAARFLWDGKPASVNFLSEISKQIYTERKYEKLIDIAPLMTIEIDSDDFTIISANTSFCQSVGIPAEQMIGKKAQKILPKNIPQKRYELANEAIKTNKIQRFTDERNDNFFYNIMIPFEFEGGKHRLFVVSQDITDLKLIERKYKRLIDTSPDAICEVDGKSHKIITVNPSMANNFNVNKDKLIGRKWEEFIPKDIFEKRFKIGYKAIKENKIIVFEDERAGRFYQSTFVPVRISKDKTNLQLIARDVTKQKKMEQQLRRSKETLELRVKERTQHLEQTMKELKESEQRYRSLIQTAPVVIAISDLKGNILDMNEVAKKIGVYHKKENIFSLYYSSKKERQNFLNILREQGSVRNWEFEFQNKNGEQNYGLLNIEQITYKGKKGYLTIYQDITQLKKAQENLNEMHDFLINVINSTSEFIFTLDENKNITMWNKTAEAKIGIPSSTVNGKNIRNISFIKNPQALLDHIKNISKGYETGETELIIKNKQGSNLIFRISVSIIEDVKTESIGYVIIGQDVTQAKHLKDKIKPGSSYLQYKNKTETYESLIIDLKSSERPVLLVTRGSMVSIHHKTKQLDVDIIYLDDDETDEQHIGNCDDLFKRISQYLVNNEHTAILIDRLDFLMMKSSFDQVLKMIYQLTSRINTSQAVLIIQINPEIYSKKQLNLLKEELALFQSTDIEDIALDESLFKMLSFIYQQNQRNVVVSYSKVGSMFNISKVTTGKRISELERKGFVSITVKGRMKSILATKKAEDLLQKRDQ